MWIITKKTQDESDQIITLFYVKGIGAAKWSSEYPDAYWFDTSEQAEEQEAKLTGYCELSSLSSYR